MPKEKKLVQIPTKRIRPNPKNPRKVYQPGLVEAMEASLKALGQLTPLKVRDLSEAERAQDPDHDAEVFGGDIRLAGGLRAGLPTMDCELYIGYTPDEIEQMGDMDNKDHNMVWLAWYEAIERRLNKPDQPSQDRVGEEMQISQQLVSQAMKILKCLNPVSREMIYHSVVKPVDDYEVTPKMVLTLVDLADPQLVEWALKVAINLKMTVADAKKLVGWVKAGNPPETFAGQKTTKAKKTPGLPPEAVDQLVELAEQVGIAKGRGEDPTPSQDKLKAFRESLSVGGKALEPSYSITSPKGFALFMRAIWDAVKKLGKAISNFAQEPEIGTLSTSAQAGQASSPESGISPTANAVGDPHAGTSTHTGSQQAQKELKPIIHWFKKTGEKLAKLPWKELGRIEHQVCKKLAHAIVSSRSSAHSNRSQNSGSWRKGLMTLFQTVLHALVYGLLQYGLLLMLATFLIFPFVPWLKPLLEFPFRFAAHLALYNFPALVWAGLHNYLWPTLIFGALLAIGLVYAWKAEKLRVSLLGAALAYLIIHGRGWSESTLPNAQTQSLIAAQQASPVPIVKIEPIVSKIISHPSPKPNKISTPTIAYQSAVAFIPNPSSPKTLSPMNPAGTLYDPKLFEFEIASVPKNSIVKDYPLTPDEGMPVDVALSRMQDVTDTDKYTMWIGDSKQIIKSANATNTTLTIDYKSTDLFNVLGGDKSPVTFLWEDVRYIHINEIDHFSKPGPQADIMYQMTVVVKGAKFPLTFQCASTDDLENLVSTMEYFIRHSRLAHDAQPAGMPYPTQGVRLSGDCVVEKIWAGSPAWNAVSNMDTAQLNSVAPRSGVNQLGASQQVKAGLGLGDHLWSIGKVTPEQQSRKDLEAGLSPNLGGLSSLPVTVFAASPSEWDKAQVAARQPGGSNNSIHPKLRKVALNAP